MAKLNKECILCKTKYAFCNRCEEYDHLPRWKAIYCSDNCRTIFMTATDYGYKHISKEDAKVILDSCDLSMKDVYHPSTRDIIDEIYAEEYHQMILDEIMPTPELETSKEIRPATADISVEITTEESIINVEENKTHKKMRSKKKVTEE